MIVAKQNGTVYLGRQTVQGANWNAGWGTEIGKFEHRWTIPGICRTLVKCSTETSPVVEGLSYFEKLPKDDAALFEWSKRVMENCLDWCRSWSWWDYQVTCSSIMVIWSYLKNLSNLVILIYDWCIERYEHKFDNDHALHYIK